MQQYIDILPYHDTLGLGSDTVSYQSGFLSGFCPRGGKMTYYRMAPNFRSKKIRGKPKTLEK